MLCACCAHAVRMLCACCAHAVRCVHVCPNNVCASLKNVQFRYVSVVLLRVALLFEDMECGFSLTTCTQMTLHDLGTCCNEIISNPGLWPPYGPGQQGAGMHPHCTGPGVLQTVAAQIRGFYLIKFAVSVTACDLAIPHTSRPVQGVGTGLDVGEAARASTERGFGPNEVT